VKSKRALLFILSTAFTASFAGMFLSDMDSRPKGAELRQLIAAITLACMAVSYALAYKPGWLYRFLTEDKHDRGHRI
jgi:hypothetical protein